MQLTIPEKNILLPKQYVEVNEEEMYYLDGGANPLTLVLALVTITGATYGGGRAAGERAYYAGLRNSSYQKWKWQIRAGVIVIAGPVMGGAFMLGFENKFYSMI